MLREKLKGKTKEDKIKIKLVRGYAKASKKQALVLESLGIRKTNQVVEHHASPTIQGMIFKVDHLVDIV